MSAFVAFRLRSARTAEQVTTLMELSGGSLIVAAVEEAEPALCAGAGDVGGEPVLRRTLVALLSQRTIDAAMVVIGPDDAPARQRPHPLQRIDDVPPAVVVEADAIDRIADFATLGEALDYAALGQRGLNFHDARGTLERTYSYSELRGEAQGVVLGAAGAVVRGRLALGHGCPSGMVARHAADRRIRHNAALIFPPRPACTAALVCRCRRKCNPTNRRIRASSGRIREGTTDRGPSGGAR